MARSDGRIEPGQRLKSAISARAWNRAQQAADIVLGTTPGYSAEAPQLASAPYTWVYGKNLSGATADRWAVLAITGLEIVPTTSATDKETRQFESMPVLTLEATNENPSSEQCVAIEPIANGKVGRIAVSGAVQIKRADLSKVSSASVLWQDSNWALIRFGGGSSVRLFTFTGAWTKGSSKTVTQIKGDGASISPAVTFSVTNHFASLAGDCGTRKGAAVKVDSTWVMIAVECV